MFTIPNVAKYGQAIAITHFAIEQFKLDCDVRIEDAYKWLFHATLGAEHAIKSKESAKEWLVSEWNQLDRPLDNEQVKVSLTPSGSLVRLNLRPYKANGGNQEALLEAFLESASQFRPDRLDLLICWQLLYKSVEVQPIGYLTSQEWIRLNRVLAPLDYPAIHHSKEYQESKQPAYRVLTGELASTLTAKG